MYTVCVVYIILHYGIISHFTATLALAFLLVTCHKITTILNVKRQMSPEYLLVRPSLPRIFSFSAKLFTTWLSGLYLQSEIEIRVLSKKNQYDDKELIGSTIILVLEESIAKVRNNLGKNCSRSKVRWMSRVSLLAL